MTTAMTSKVFKLTVDCKNAAFDDDPWAELAAILRRVADKLDNARGRAFGPFDFPGVRDTNGNRVGSACVKLSRGRVQSMRVVECSGGREVLA